MENKVLEAMQYRHAAKEFDSLKKIDEKTFNQILEAGRLSPSSFGLEHWKFVVVQNQDLKQDIEKASFNQKQISQSSHTLIILNKIEDVKTGSIYAKNLFESRMPEQPAKFVTEFHSEFTKNFTEKEVSDWSKRQCYIAAANMMTMAAYFGVDSCPMEGFVESQIQKILEIDPKEYGVALVIPFGFRVKEPREKIRHELQNIVDFK